MEITGVRSRKIYALIQMSYVALILAKLILTYSNLHITEISVYALFVIITPSTMKTLISSYKGDINEYLRLSLYSIVEISYLSDSVGFILVNFIPIIFIISSLLFFTFILKMKDNKKTFKAVKINSI